jgi:pimeloyl-ACP methyl ester carboxylesterase
MKLVESAGRQRCAAAAAQLSPGLEHRRFQSAGRSISAVIAGGRFPPVVFLHGNSSSKAVWSYQLKCMRAAGRACAAIDLPGHGESDDAADPWRTYSFPGYAEAVAAVFTDLQWDEIDLAGWSLGGHVALELLATDPRIRSVLIAGTPPARPCADVLARVFHATPDLDFAGSKELSRDQASTYGQAMMGGREFLTDELLAGIRRTDGRARACMFENALRGTGTDQRLTVETCTKPICVVHGEADAFVRLEYLSTINFRALWKNRVQVMRGAGHAPQWQFPSRFNAILSAFLKDVDESCMRASNSRLRSAKAGV